MRGEKSPQHAAHRAFSRIRHRCDGAVDRGPRNESERRISPTLALPSSVSYGSAVGGHQEGRQMFAAVLAAIVLGLLLARTAGPALGLDLALRRIATGRAATAWRRSPTGASTFEAAAGEAAGVDVIASAGVASDDPAAVGRLGRGGHRIAVLGADAARTAAATRLAVGANRHVGAALRRSRQRSTMSAAAASAFDMSAPERKADRLRSSAPAGGRPTKGCGPRFDGTAGCASRASRFSARFSARFSPRFSRLSRNSRCPRPSRFSRLNSRLPRFSRF